MELTKKCSGCGACSCVCPKGAIKIELNEYGFYQPKIDKDKCINCGLCKKVCIDNIKNETNELNKNENYIAVTKNKKVLDKSSSGGIGYIISKKFIENGYPICGVQYNKVKEIAEHVIITKEEDLCKIQGSKYIPSYTEEAFKEIIKLDKAVIFGTPCQIAGIDAVLKQKNKRKNFILIDIFCHRVPSLLSFKNHLEYLKKNNKIKNEEDVTFRSKKEYILKIGKTYSKKYQYDPFYYLFLRGLIFQEACYTCPYRRTGYSDIRLGDFTNSKFLNLDYSPSTMIINTDKGKEVVEQIKDSIFLFAEDFEKVDKVQDKGDKTLPKKYNYYLNKLKNGKYPFEILRKEMIIMNIKGCIKKIIKFFKKNNNIKEEDINSIMNGEVK